MAALLCLQNRTRDSPPQGGGFFSQHNWDFCISRDTLFFVPLLESVGSALFARGVDKDGALLQQVVANLELSTIDQFKAVHDLVVAKCKFNQFHGFSKGGRVELNRWRRGNSRSEEHTSELHSLR